MSKSTDLTQGPIIQKLLMVAVPIMGTQLMQMAYNLTDMFWLGRMPEATVAVAASGMGGMFMWLSMALMLIGRMGAEIGVSQSLGRGEPDEAQRYAQNASAIALLLGIVYGAVMVFLSGPLIGLFNIQEQPLREASSRYLMIVGLGVPLSYVSAAITGMFNGAGNSRLSFYCNAIGLIVNMALDPLMILNLGWGIAGAAIATVLAQGLVLLLFVLFAKRHRARPFEYFRVLARPDGAHARQIVRWSAPVALESGLFSGLAMVVTRMVGAFGADALAAQRIGSQIESLSWLLGGGFSSAVTAFTGQNFGAQKWDRIWRGFRVSLVSLLCWETLVSLLLFFCGRSLMGVFISDEAVLDIGQTYLKILAFCQIFAALEGACAGVFRGVGRTVPPSVCSIISNALRVPLCYLLSRTSLGMNGLWLGISISAALRGLLIAASSISLRDLSSEGLRG